MASNAPISIASAIQSASINRAPSPTHDINPSTAASERKPVILSSDPLSSPSSTRSTIPASTVYPAPRRAGLPPLPDMRFEQSYLKSIEGKEGWAVAWITARDQVVMPLVQGTVYALVAIGWRVWNRRAGFEGRSYGARLRRWWWGINNWKVPESKAARDRKMAGEIQEYYTGHFSTAGQD